MIMYSTFTHNTPPQDSFTQAFLAGYAMSNSLDIVAAQRPAHEFYLDSAPLSMNLLNTLPSATPSCMSSGDLQGTSMQEPAPAFYVAPAPFQASSSYFFSGYEPFCGTYCNTMHAAAPPLYVGPTSSQATPSSAAPPPLSSIAPCLSIPSPSAPLLLSQCLGMQLLASSPAPPLLSPIDPRHPTFSSPTLPPLSPTACQPSPSSPAPPLLSPIDPRHPTFSSPALPPLSPTAPCQPSPSSPAPPLLSPIDPRHPTFSSPALPPLSPTAPCQPSPSSPAPPLLSPIDPRHPTFSSPALPPLSPTAPCQPSPSSPAPPLLSPIDPRHPTFSSPALPPLSPTAPCQPLPSSPAPALPSQYPLSLSVTPAPSLHAPTPLASPSNGTFPISSSSGTMDAQASSNNPDHPVARRYLGEKQVSKRGKHSVLIYRIPGTTRSFTFYRSWANKKCEKYGCLHCLKERKKRGEQAMGEFIEVIGNEFLSDPCRMDHECVFAKYAEEIGNRHVYKELQNIRRDPACAEKRPVKVYLDMVAAPFETDDAEMEDSIRAAVRRSGYHSRRQPILRSLAVWKNRAVTMDHVPPEFSTLRDGSTFLHYQAPGFHIYYSLATIQKACEAGLHSIVADGMHSLHPRSLGCHAQLYCVHGVCSEGIEVPLLYCITAKKTEEVYLKVFGHLKSNITGDAPRRVILDFEKAAISATRKIFPRASVEGCAFHLAQAWNRRRDALGLRRYMQGMERDARIVQWWDTIKGIVFLPPSLMSEVRALQKPPIPSEHSAYQRFEDFLKYLRETWFQGPFKNMWCKWKLEELRTTNLAEAFHRRLKAIMYVEHPPLSTLIEALRKINYEARAILKRHQQDRSRARVLRKRDKERRAKIAEEMREFEQCYQNGTTREEVEQFCRKMSKYVTNKAI